MFKMYALGREGASAICKQLNDAGHRTRNGHKWGRRMVLYMLKNPVYVGKIRWREVLYEGQHDPLVSDVLFEKASEVLQDRNEDLKGRCWHNGEERLLTGITKCARCNSHMFGGGSQKKGVYIPYYVCSKRFNDHDCQQDYVRADLLETAITEDIKTMYRDEQFMARLWTEANKRLGAEKPNLEKEIEKVEGEAAKTQATLDRYFEAFEAGTLKAELCNEKVGDLRVRLEKLEKEKRDLEARRERLELPAIDRDMLASIVENFERVMAEGPNPLKKHVLRKLVKKVLVHDRRTIEVWYGLPNAGRCEDWNNWLPG
jgi:site-specific DNA recombinase